MGSTGPTIDDSLIILSFNDSPEVSSRLAQLFLKSFTTPNLSFFSHQDDYLLKLRKGDRLCEVFVEFLILVPDFDENPANFFLCVDSEEEWDHLRENTEALGLLKSDGRLKAIVFDSFLETVVTSSDFFEKNGISVPVFYLNSEDLSESNDDFLNKITNLLLINPWNTNVEALPELIEESSDFQRFGEIEGTQVSSGNLDTINAHSEPSTQESDSNFFLTMTTEAKNHKKSPEEKNPNLSDHRKSYDIPQEQTDENSDEKDDEENLMKVFGKIMNFKDTSKNLSPRSKRMKASWLIQQLEGEVLKGREGEVSSEDDLASEN